MLNLVAYPAVTDDSKLFISKTDCRSAVKLCEMVVLPYNSLLHAPTRKAIGLNLKNSVIIIDEAHNLLETIAGIHSVSISGNQLAMAYSQLTQYKLKYKCRLKASNLLYIKQILFILASFIKFLGGTPGRDPSEATTIVKEETKMMNVYTGKISSMTLSNKI